MENILYYTEYISDEIIKGSDNTWAKCHTDKGN